tara:strand:- start:1314 stop:1868 length:555 start_codon:yes stop_codon:yes gene_type:complete
MTRILILLFFFLFCFSVKSDEKQKIIENFKTIKNLSFYFKQTINGITDTGNCIIQYPKKIYCAYSLRNKKILVSNGKSLVIKNKKNNQYYYYPLHSTPFELLLDKNYILNVISKSKTKLINDKYYYFLIKNSNYEINIFFDKKNHDLLGWQTEDIYQNMTITFIYDLKINTIINKKLFILPTRN